MACIEARGLRKAFKDTVALDGVDLTVEAGRIVGLIGPNGAGKSTALQAMLGLTAYQGELKVLGLDPWAARDQLMTEVCFIADVAVLPRWMRVWQALDYVAGVHPRFDRSKAEGFLARTSIKMSELLGLQPGDIITTEKQTSGDVFVEVEGKQKFRGQLGQFRGKRAVRITAVTTERAETTADGFGARR